MSNVSVDTIAGGKYVLWGANWSLYTATLRPYLIKKGIDYVEINPSHPEFMERVVPHVGYITHPILETPEGEIIADSTLAIDLLESRFPDLPSLPEDKSLAALAQLIHAYGMEGLQKQAMYWRWNSTFESRLWARTEFRSQHTREDWVAGKREYADAFAVSMRAYLAILGIALDHDVDVAIETSTVKLYEVLNNHFLEYPYLLGGVPSLADYGMMGALYAHLGRDIVSAPRIKSTAPALYRWIETMGRKVIVDPETWHVPPEYFAIDALPETLIAILKLIADDYVPEIKATVDCYNQWVGEPGARPTGTFIDVEGTKRCHQVIGEITQVQQGAAIKRVCLLDSAEKHQRFQEGVEQMSAGEKKALVSVLQVIGAGDYVDLRLNRNMKRDDYTWVLV
jgi:glutathione S-transferase